MDFNDEMILQESFQQANHKTIGTCRYDLNLNKMILMNITDKPQADSVKTVLDNWKMIK